jgi:hypothetical protein
LDVLDKDIPLPWQDDVYPAALVGASSRAVDIADSNPQFAHRIIAVVENPLDASKDVLLQRPGQRKTPGLNMNGHLVSSSVGDGSKSSGALNQIKFDCF